MIAICRRYPSADVAAFIPYLVVTFAPALAKDRTAAAVVGALVERLGVTDPAKAGDAIRAHYEDNPPNQALVEEFERYFREHLKNASPDVVAGKLADVIGATTSKQPLQSGARPPGTIPANPFARFHRK